jgi:hypothetical protein
MESEAVLQILNLVRNEEVSWISSDILEFELKNNRLIRVF